MRLESKGWKQVVGATLAAVALGGCGEPSPYGNRPVQSRAALTAATSCEQLEQAIEDLAVSEMRAQFRWYSARDRSEPGLPPTFNSGQEQITAVVSGPADHTTTNTQVAGVDEADFIKNDGTRIFALSRNRLVTARSWPVEALAVMGSIEIEGYPTELFLDGDRVMVFSGLNDKLVVGSTPRELVCSMGFHQPTTTKLTTLDVSNLAAPVVVDEVYLPGTYLSSRRIDDSVRVVMTDRFDMPEGYQANVPYDPEAWGDPARMRDAADAIMRRNERLIRERSLDEWLRVGKRRSADGAETPIANRCSDYHLPNGPTRSGLVTVATIDLADGGAQVSRTAVLGRADTVYASPKALYLASQHWWWETVAGQHDATYLHKFDLTAPERAAYLASGTIEGTVLNQFSLDEHDGYLRVATTETAWQEGARVGAFERETSNRVSVLEQRGDRLELKGKTGALAPTETIFAARFMGARGFLVTYRQVDPLFTLDLSDPSNPRVLGELKIPGFSTYLHPVNEHTLLGIGEDRDETGSWSSRRLKVSLFDVSDMSRPVETFTQLIGTENAWSEAAHSHKAFNYFAAKGTLAIPYTDYDRGRVGQHYWSAFTSALQVFDVDPERGFTPRGMLSLDDVYAAYGHSGWSYFYQPSVRRSVMADDYVYAISDAGIRVAHVDSLDRPIATAAFTALWPANGGL